MAKRIPIYCPDSCYLIDWVQRTEGREKETAAMADMLAEMEAGKCKVVVSSAVVAEVLPGKCGARYADFRKLLSGGSKLTVWPLDVPTALMVAQLREGLDFAKTSRRTVDAMHLAAAIQSGADFLYTRDLPLLALGEKVARWLHERSLPELRIQELEARGLPLAPARPRSGGAD